jgi:hypothetical protein
MSLEATIQENTNAIRALIAALAQGIPTTAAQVAAVVAETPAVATEVKADKPAKKTQAAATQASPTPTASDSSQASSSETVDEPVPVYQDASAAIIKLSRSKGRDAAVSVLAKFGAAKLPDVKPEQFAAVIAAANEAMGA